MRGCIRHPTIQVSKILCLIGLKERVEQRLYQENLQTEAEVRSLISDAEAALVAQSDDGPEDFDVELFGPHGTDPAAAFLH